MIDRGNMPGREAAEYSMRLRVRVWRWGFILATVLVPLMPLAAQTAAAANDDQEGQRLLTVLKQSIEGEYHVASAMVTTKVSGEACFTRLSRTNKLQPTLSYGGGLMRWEAFDSVAVNPLQKKILVLQSSYMTNTGKSLRRTELMFDTPERAEAVARAMNALISHCKARRAQLDSAKNR
jgi:hypothetical protein